ETHKLRWNITGNSFAEMFLFYLIVSCALLDVVCQITLLSHPSPLLIEGSFAGEMFERVCYGKYLNLPSTYAPPFFKGQLYFTPTKRGPRRLLMDNGEVKDPRIKTSVSSVRITDLTEKDDGTFSASFVDGRQYTIVELLEILDCVDVEVKKIYGDSYFFSIPERAEFLEFTPFGNQQQTWVLWNRTDPQTNKGGRGQMKRYSFEMDKLTQADGGFYNIREKDNSLLSRIRIKVNENKRHYDADVGKSLSIQYPRIAAKWTVTFVPKNEEDHQTVMTEGSLITVGDVRVSKQQIRDRIWVEHNALRIDPVESGDSGMFEFRDPQGNLAQTVQVVVNESLPTFVFIAIIVGFIFGVFACCCCMRKCCCKKRTFKRAESAPQTAAAPANYYHLHRLQLTLLQLTLLQLTLQLPADEFPCFERIYIYLGWAIGNQGENILHFFFLQVYNPVNIHVNPFQSESGTMVVRVLLGVCVCRGLSDDVKSYGDTYRMWMFSSTATIEFIQKDSSDVTVLWRHDDPLAKEDARRKERSGSYVIYNVTRRDSGRYVMRNKAQKVLLNKTLNVVYTALQYSCSGRYEVRDNHGDLAIKVFLEIARTQANRRNEEQGTRKAGTHRSTHEAGNIDDTTKNKGKVPNDAEPGQESQQLSQPSETLYPAQPSYSPTEPLMHNPPPSYSQVVAAAEQTYTPTVPVPSEAEPKFELKGVTFLSAPPLSSESSFSNVYNSDKLNFL
ncbi:hypothetical protein L3Q82_020608, partial [Scortum barcoo]